MMTKCLNRVRIGKRKKNEKREEEMMKRTRRGKTGRGEKGCFKPIEQLLFLVEIRYILRQKNSKRRVFQTQSFDVT